MYRIGRIPQVRAELHCLTGIRAYLIAGVLLHHMLRVDTDILAYGLGLGRHIASPAAQRIAQLAAMGVDIFFVLSGFIIAYRFRDTLRTPTSQRLWHYLLRRLARIWPVYAFSLLVLLAVHAAGWNGPLTDPAALPMHVTLTYAWWNNGESWNLPGWSVSVEFFCYLLFPLLALLYPRGPRATALGMALLLAYFTSDPRWSIAGPAALLRASSQFAFGMLLFDVYAHRPLRRADASAFAAAGLFALVLLTGPGRHLTLCLSYLCLAVVLLALASPGPLLRRVFANRAALYVGAISYSLYAMHYPVIRVLGLWRQPLHEYLLAAPASQFMLWVALLVASLCMLLVAAVTHVLIERPAIAWAHRHTRL